MKSIFLVISILMCMLFSFPAFSGGGGISGGTKMITVQVCDLDYPSQCRVVRYVDRFTDEDRANALNPKADCMLPGNEGIYIPCSDDKKEYGIPKFLQRLGQQLFPSSTPPSNVENVN